MLRSIFSSHSRHDLTVKGERMSTNIRRLIFSVGSLLAILACSVQSFLPVTDPSADSTAAALTISAAIQNLASATPFPANTFVPPLPPAQPPTLTFTPPGPTAPPTFTPNPYFTATVANVPLITVSVDTNCRVGPGKAYELVGALLTGETVEVFARDPTGNYWYIRNPDDHNSFCWVWGEYATITGNTSTLPVYTPEPTPTPAPNFDVNYANRDSCVGWWVKFAIKNTGSMPFESIKLDVKDTNTSTNVSSIYNEFTTFKGCGGKKVMDPLNPGDSVTVNSSPFAYELRGHKFKATITLCTDDGLTGVCVSKTITFKVH
jgi:hypothetical protein